MKSTSLLTKLGVLFVSVAFASISLAGACCDRAVDKAKAGKACAECVKKDCCKEAIKKLGAEAKPCQTCAKKKAKAETKS